MTGESTSADTPDLRSARLIARAVCLLGVATLWSARLTSAQSSSPGTADKQPPHKAGAAPPHVGVPAGWVGRYPCRPPLRPVVQAPAGAFTRAEACAAAVAVYEAWIAAARAGTRPFTKAALDDTGRVDAAVLLYGPGTLVVQPDGKALSSLATVFTVELHFGPGIAPVVGVVDPRRGVQRLYPGEAFSSSARYNRVLHPRRSRSSL